MRKAFQCGFFSEFTVFSIISVILVIAELGDKVS